MATGRLRRRRHRLQRRERRPDREGHRRPAHPRAVGTHAAGDSRRRPLLHRPDRAEGAPLAHPFQRSFSNGKTNASLRVGFQRKAVKGLPFLIFINTRKGIPER